MTKDINERLRRHNASREKTRIYAPFDLIYIEECKDRIEVRKREKYWKSGVGKEQLRKIRDHLL